jgi:hypothetical protein
MSLLENVRRLVKETDKTEELAESLYYLARLIESSEMYDLPNKLDELSFGCEEIGRCFRTISEQIEQIQSELGLSISPLTTGITLNPKATSVKYASDSRSPEQPINPVVAVSASNGIQGLVNDFESSADEIQELVNELQSSAFVSQANEIVQLQNQWLKQAASIFPKTTSGLMLLSSVFGSILAHPGVYVVHAVKRTYEVAQAGQTIYKTVQKSQSPYSIKNQLTDWDNHENKRREESEQKSRLTAEAARREAERKPDGQA